VKYKFFNPDQVQLVGEDDEDFELLTALVENRLNTRYVATSWQAAAGDPSKRTADLPDANAEVAQVNFTLINEKRSQ
jgi:hypothetical protein